MTRLTTFSKVLIIGLPALLIILMFGMCWSCSSGCNQPNQNYGYQQPVQPQPQVVYVQQPDGSSVMMNYLLWKSLMDQGGETHVHNYYNQHRNEPEFQSQQQQQYRQVYEQEKVQTQKSNGFGSKPVETQKSNGFGNKPVETNKSNGFGTYKSPEPTKTISTQKSSGFGTVKPSSSPVQTQKSSGFGSKSSVNTTKSSGFGKKQ